jgi:SlyX protein
MVTEISTEKEVVASDLVELQVQVAFLEDTISQLNQAVANQQKDLSAMSEQLEALKQQYQELRQQQGGGGASGDNAMEPPPHY